MATSKTKMELAIIDIDNESAEVEENRFIRHIEMIVRMNLQIPAHVATTFWLNILNDAFVKNLTYDLVEHLVGSGDMEESSIEGILLSIFFAHIAFQKSFNISDVQDFVEALFASNDMNIRKSLLLLQTYKYTGEGLLSGMTANMPGQSLTSFHETHIPLISLAAWFLNMRKGQDNVSSFIRAVKSRIESKCEKRELFVVLHCLKLCLTLFPTIQASDRQELIEVCRNCFGVSNPLSSVTDVLSAEMELEASYPLSLYFNLLERSQSLNYPMNGVCPLIFDSEITMLPVFLYTPTNDSDASLDSCYVKFGKHFFAQFGKGDLPFDSVVTLLEMFGTNESDISAVRSKFSLPEHPCVLDKYDLLVPIVNFETIKVKGCTDPCTEKFPDEKTASFGSKKDKLYVFENNADELFSAKSWNEWKDNVSDMKELSRDEEVVRVVVVGTEATLASFLVSYFAKQASDPVFAKMKFTVHFIPSRSGKISEFLSSFDNVYSKFVAPLCSTCTNMAPVLVESGGAPLMPAIDDRRVDGFEPNLFFSYPSPMHLFKCGVHHYMRFAEETVSVPIWECKMEYSNGKKVVVPFIVDVVCDGLRGSGRVNYVTLGGKKANLEVRRGKKIAFNSICQEYVPCSDIQSLQMDEERRIPILSAELKCQRSSPITIDGRNYGMPKLITLTLPSAEKRLEFATFVSYHFV